MRKFRMYLICDKGAERSASFSGEYTEEQLFENLDKTPLKYEIREVVLVPEERVVHVKTVRSIV